jgi:hypothetical protein
LSKKLVLIIVGGVVLSAVLAGVVLGVLTSSKSRRDEKKVGTEEEVKTGIKDPRGRDLPMPNPENTVVPPQDVQPPAGEPIFIPKQDLPPQTVPPDASTAIKTTGGIRETEASKAFVICSPMPTTHFWVEIEEAKLGDRTWRSNFEIQNFQGDGTYEVPVGIAMRYPDGQLYPYADGKAIVEISGGGSRGTIKAEMVFLEGLTSVSLAFVCGGGGGP